MERLRVAVVGSGVMGRHHVRVVRQLADRYELVAVNDADEGVARSVAEDVPAVSFDDAIERADAVILATPTATHADLGRRVVEAGRHLLVEKPIAHSVEAGEALVAAAEAAGVRVAVGHTERFNPVVRWLREKLAGEHVLTIDIERIGPRPTRIRDVGVVTDLGVHDLDLVGWLTGSPLVRARCVARATRGGHEDVARIVVETESGVVGAIHANWLAPFKARKVTIATTRGVLYGDLLRFTASAHLGFDADNPRAAVVEEAELPLVEPLVAQAIAFHALVRHGDGDGIVSGAEGLRALSWVPRCLEDAGRTS